MVISLNKHACYTPEHNILIVNILFCVLCSLCFILRKHTKILNKLFTNIWSYRIVITGSDGITISSLCFPTSTKVAKASANTSWLPSGLSMHPITWKSIVFWLLNTGRATYVMQLPSIGKKQHNISKKKFDSDSFVEEVEVNRNWPWPKPIPNLWFDYDQNR